MSARGRVHSRCSIRRYTQSSYRASAPGYAGRDFHFPPVIQPDFLPRRLKFGCLTSWTNTGNASNAAAARAENVTAPQ